MAPAGRNLDVHWLVPAQKRLQGAQRDELVRALKGRMSALAALLSQMPVTGRVPFPSMDARWLEVNPSQDPILEPGDLIVESVRADHVNVLRPSGHLCQVQFVPGSTLLAYLRACDAREVDQVWVVQPDGMVFLHGVALWNRTESTEPAPGSWIWAPGRDDPITLDESNRLASFLATQTEAPASYPWRYQRRLPVNEPATGVDFAAPRGLHLSSNDWGAVGLLQTPNARMEPVGTATLTYNRTVPYGSLKARLQPVTWLSFDFGYVSISGRPYGPASLSGDQSYKDKSADVKLRLWKESHTLPEVALGWRDLIGTGHFASEYIVASKRFGDLDFSAGLAFGYMGGRQDVGNPLGLLSSRFRSRPAPGSVSGGEFNARSYFRGRAAVFGGMQYQWPSDKWLLKLEYEGNDYAHEPAGVPIEQRSPFNIGVVYRYAPWLDLSAGVERGRRAMLTVSARTQLDGLRTPKYLDARAVPVKPSYPSKPEAGAVTVRDIEAQSDTQVEDLSTDSAARRMTLTLSYPDIGYERPLIDKVTAVAHRDAPASVKQFEVRLTQQGVPVAAVEVDRGQWVRRHTEFSRPSDRQLDVIRTVPSPDGAAEANAEGSSLAVQSHPRQPSLGLGLHYRQNLGGPDGFLLYQLAADLQADWRLHPGTWLSGTMRLRLLDNYGNFKYTAPSNLPRVRTYVREYLVTERLTVPNLQLNHFGHFGAQGDHFYLAYAGLLESMFAGVGAEYLYRPVNSRLALGLDLNRVRQRDFEQRLSLRDYKVTTGHATAYWDTGVSDILLKLSAGRYLAGDTGVTVDASRVFRNGVSIGAYATKTNVSAEQFGEGSFDKGVYVNIPFDAMLPRSGGGTASIVYAPLIRDGGAKLARRFTLFDMTKARDPRALEYGDGTAH